MSNNYALVQNLVQLKKLPDSWDILSFESVIKDCSGGNGKIQKSEFLESGSFPIIDQGKSLIAGFTNNEDLLVKCKPPYIVFGDHTRNFKYIQTAFAMGADGTKVLKAISNTVIEKYLYYFMLTLNVPNTGYNRHFKYIKSIKIPIPLLEEQKKIAEILDAADSLRQKDKQLVEHYDRLSQSLFLDMFGNVFNNVKKFEECLFSEIVEKVQIGPFGSQLHKHDYIENGIPLINPIHIVDSKIVPNSLFTLQDEKYDSLPNYHLKIGDLIMGRRGEMGRCALVTEKENGFFCGTGSLYLRLNKNVNPTFLLKVITSDGGKEYLERNAQGVTMMNLNKKIILNIKIGLPPIELQNKFETSISEIRKQKSLAQQALQKSDDLFNSLLQRAFKGLLTNS
ncbi:restriction endonuclease subunit S [Photobacterium iliopiscarium]|uniref:Restriction endonuclease subunit S n=1 Tax=Photobacterium iliopiscarium TaxID=56192 RepID=A0ABX5GMH3_9GAMM|nr:restriction endonuclease subunit S [Photobacterium iliopiscarium]PSW92299.1 restriction endonuclease subunit S [Photobacterium iliopiscarium]